MDDSYIIANFYDLCRLCLVKSGLTLSIFGNTPDDEDNKSLNSKISECLDLQLDPNDGLPTRICYKCLFKVDTCSKFKSLCLESEVRLKHITNQVNELNTSNSSEFNYVNAEHKQQTENYIVEDSVVMVVDPSLDYDSSEESENVEQGETDVVEQDNIPEVEHVQESYFKNVSMCQYCDQAFISREKCKDHEENFHDPNRPYKCIECSIVFAERNLFVGHIKTVHGSDKPYNCPECDKCFGRRSDLRKHSIVHTGIRPYQCQYCLKSFSRNTNLSKHLRIHAGHKPHVCPKCPRSFVAKGDLQRHILIHSGTKPYACQNCPLTFGRKDKLVKHELRHVGVTSSHGNEENNDMVVSVNPYSNLMSSPNEHLNSNDFELPRVPDHIAGEGSFSNHLQKAPSMSNKQFQSSPTKQKSSNSKNKPKNIKCHQCPKRFSSLDAYKTHVSISHIGSRVFQYFPMEENNMYDLET
ncbi:unnamed protein product [Pieris macdunnoughi]|uniref:Uncharacterized protein n=1 Tax=Pieris macdunnoughi TaxID=345717 RepID=A0A821N6E9_9NEOP|nr:unnamed protein product [Pieris macdunnoughi]